MRTRMMSFLLGLFFLGSFCESFATIQFSNEFANAEITEYGKVYVDPETVYVTSDGIFVNFQGNAIPVNSINADANGVYFSPEDYNCTYDQDWKCPNRRCGWINNGNREYCVRCNHRRPFR